ncbi:hypothetical protein DY000_02058468 [Brassica cretica]|uniref:Uncharacterized protein n=1 Tax=Brassica cretica TaxID=69181 RepID=A0ABQ7AN89_BRACR|nr:hypothetical protein DY000_02058468 [Brassica cretica]
MAAIKVMGLKEPKPIASDRAQKRRSRGPGNRGVVPEIAEQLRRSRSRLTIYRKEKRHEEGHVENPRENYTLTSILFPPVLRLFSLQFSFVSLDLVQLIVFDLIHQ